ncbi:6-pyruvoyl trahydropterin synthase family protein [Chromohalobacter canadensis]|uniref:6-carboxy-5,6,7,8-tetrahydropterin synthase n=1 Tax=Chromohalobacter canadensis TaxID=141389 RepID=A0ABZ0YBS3_9GAMM|nr:6-carboxytetrahydropterin synthase [Chromohalobacter canadensis]MCK0768794.1 6-carboxytetrahydropterin synthase [Chromohalobacter canadensis]WQH09293.1 6-carboxytetrahydropterin synthase [Chromohalobacter canadensis]
MTLFVNHLTHIDASLWSPTHGLMGASWHVDAELDGELGSDGMLFDFGEVKPWIKSRLDEGLDHTLLVPTEAPGIQVFDCAEGLCLRTQFPYPMELRGPRQSFTLLPWSEITPEQLATHLSTELSRRPPAKVEAIRLRLRDEDIETAAYTYSHGLKHHVGNCQRIAHGHRSRLHIWRNGQRDPELEHQWAQALDACYLIHDEDLAPQADESLDTLSVAYRADQGRFHLTLPSERCHLLTTPTTIEHIAAWLAEKIALETHSRIRVQAFEGIDKGAIAEAS